MRWTGRLLAGCFALTLLVGGGAGSGCLAPAGGAVVPSSSAKPDASPPPAAAGSVAPLPPFEIAPESRALVVAAGAFVSRGHQRGRFETIVASNDEARLAEAARAGEVFPRGFVVCSEHSANGAVVIVACMRKSSEAPNDWVYAVSDAYGKPFRRSGSLGDCSGCHAAAPRDGLFPLPPSRGP